MRGNKAYWVILIALLALAAAGTARLHSLVSLAGDRWPAQNQPGSLTREIGELAEKNRIAAADLALARELIPDAVDEDAPEAIRLTAGASGVDVGEVKPESRQRGGGAVRQSRFRLSLSGSYDQLAVFINRLEGFGPGAAKRLFVVDSLDIAAGADGRHTATAVVRAFAYDAKAPERPAGRPAAADLKTSLDSRSFVYAGGGRDPMAIPDFAGPLVKER